MQYVTKRELKQSRKIMRSFRYSHAKEAVGDIQPGCEIFGLTGGQFSLIDLMIHCLNTTGPAGITISTWTAANADLQFAHSLLSSGQIRSMRFLIDTSFQARQPLYCQALRERFGDDCIRITKNHCKFVIIENGSWHLVIRTSMNLNLNRRLESFEISDDSRLSQHLNTFVDFIFKTHQPGEQFKKSAHANDGDFKTLSAPSVLSRDPLGTNIDKIGITTSKGEKIHDAAKPFNPEPKNPLD